MGYLAQGLMLENAEVKKYKLNLGAEVNLIPRREYAVLGCVPSLGGVNHLLLHVTGTCPLPWVS